MDKLAEFVLRKRVVKEPQKPQLIVPWYKRPLEREEFSYRQGNDGKFYVRHKEWSKRTWIGGYNTVKEVSNIVDSYVRESLKEPLDRKTNSNIHSITVENETVFFKPHSIKCV